METLEIGQKVFVHTPDETFFDSGRILAVKHEGFEPDVLDQISVRSDAQDGKEVIFRFIPETDMWVHFFQDPLGDVGFLVFDEHEPAYKIFGVED